MTIAEIRKELKEIHEEMKKWDGAKGPFTPQAIRRRELILLKQQILYRLEDAILLKDKTAKLFNLDLYKIIDKYLLELERDKND